jgi:tRNA (guanine37-N1)-methyltransferase
VAEAVVRLIPGVLGDDRSAVEESFTDPQLLDHPHYTRPRVWRGRDVPEVLLGGDHGAIAKWRAQAAAERTRERRPDL